MEEQQNVPLMRLGVDTRLSKSIQMKFGFEFRELLKGEDDSVGGSDHLRLLPFDSLTPFSARCQTAEKFLSAVLPVRDGPASNQRFLFVECLSMKHNSRRVWRETERQGGVRGRSQHLSGLAVVSVPFMTSQRAIFFKNRK